MNGSLFNATDLPTTLSPTTTAASSGDSDAALALHLLILRMQWAVLNVLSPAITIVGFVGNVLSIIVIAKDGLRKSSNVLLIALALSDSTVLTGNAVDILFSTRVSRVLKYGITMNRFLFYLNIVFTYCLMNLGILCSYSFPMLITIERLCAVFLPLKFHLIITPVRTLVAIVVLVTVYSVYIIFLGMKMTLSQPFAYRGVVYMTFRRSAFYYKHTHVYSSLTEITNELTGSVPIVVLTLGSAVIGYKVKMAARRRAQMMSQGDPKAGKKTASQSRTTKTLLTVCVTFLILSGLCYIYSLVRTHTWLPYDVDTFLYHVNSMVLCISCACNFFIYVHSNSKFRDRLVAMFSRKGNNSGKLGKPNIVYSEHTSKTQ